MFDSVINKKSLIIDFSKQRGSSRVGSRR